MADKKQTLAIEITTKADKAKQEMAELDKRAKDLEGKPIEIPVDVTGTEGVKAKVGDVSRAADGAKNAFANLAGNTAQDMGSMLGPLGGVGVAVGQLVEYTTDAAQGADGLGTALKGAASMVGPLAALSLATLAVTNALERHKARQAELKKINEDLVESFVEGTGVVEDFGDALEDAFSAGTASDVQTLTKLLSDRLDPKEFQRVAVAFGEVGVSMDDLGSILPQIDQDFQSFAATQLRSVGLSEKQAKAAAELIDKYDHLDSLSNIGQGKAILGDSFSPEQLARIDKMTHGLQEFADQAQNIKLQEVATQALDMARAFDAGRVAAAEAGGGLPVEQYLRYKDAVDEAARAQEEGARLAEESGTIQEQVGRQMADAADLVTEAMDKAKDAQDNWLIQNVDYQGAVDGFTDALEGLGKSIDDGRQKTGLLSGDFEGNTKFARDNRDALGEVYEAAVTMNDGMKDAGFSVDGAKVAMDNAAESAYEMALQMGLPQEEAIKIRDKIREIPSTWPSEVVIAEQGYEDVKAKKEDLEKDTESTHFIYGVLDRSVLNAINSLPPGSIPSSGRSVAPAGPVGPSVGLLAAPAPTAAPSTSTTVHVNLSGSIVADSFELQRVVSRAVRQGVRINGARRYQP